MGNIVIPQRFINQWREESKLADQLLKIQPINKQEEQLINSVQRETKFKVIMAMLLSGTFCASIRRYFPETVFTENNMVYVLTSFSVIIPTFTIASINTNKDIISKLQVIKNNHEILNS